MQLGSQPSQVQKRLSEAVASFTQRWQLCQAAGPSPGCLCQIWLPQIGTDGSTSLYTQGLPFSVSGVRDLLALFRCTSCRYKFSTDVTKPCKMGAIGRVYCSGEPEMSHNVQTYDAQRYLRVAEAKRCRVHSTIFMPLFSSVERAQPFGVVEVVLCEADVLFPALVDLLQTALQEVQLYTAVAEDHTMALGLRQWPAAEPTASGIESASLKKPLEGVECQSGQQVTHCSADSLHSGTKRRCLHGAGSAGAAGAQPSSQERALPPGGGSSDTVKVEAAPAGSAGGSGEVRAAAPGGLCGAPAAEGPASAAGEAPAGPRVPLPVARVESAGAAGQQNGPQSSTVRGAGPGVPCTPTSALQEITADSEEVPGMGPETSSRQQGATSVQAGLSSPGASGARPQSAARQRTTTPCARGLPAWASPNRLISLNGRLVLDPSPSPDPSEVKVEPSPGRSTASLPPGALVQVPLLTPFAALAQGGFSGLHSPANSGLHTPLQASQTAMGPNPFADTQEPQTLFVATSPMRGHEVARGSLEGSRSVEASDGMDLQPLSRPRRSCRSASRQQQKYVCDETEGEDDLLSEGGGRTAAGALLPSNNRKEGGAGKRLSLEDLQTQFGVGLRDAAANLRICPTTLKRACRRHGITRWPRRQMGRGLFGPGEGTADRDVISSGADGQSSREPSLPSTTEVFPSTEQRLELESLPQLLGQALMRSSSTPQGASQLQHRGQMQDAHGSWHGRQLGAPWQLDTASMQTLDGFGSSLGDVNNLSISSRPTSISLEMAHDSGLGSGMAASMTANGGSASVLQQQQQQAQVNHLLLQHSKLQNGGQFALDQGAFSWPAMNFGGSLIQPKALPASPTPGDCPLLQQVMLSDRNHTPLDNSLDLLGDCNTKQGLVELPFLF